MTERSKPWNGTSTGDATDAPYDAPSHEAAIYRALAGVEVNADDSGVVVGALNQLAASVAGQTVTVASGRAVVDGTWYENDANKLITIDVPVTSTRVDRIVVRKAFAAQTVRLTWIKNVSEGTGTPPAITQTRPTTWDMRAYIVTITTGGVITLTDERQWAPDPRTPISFMYNNSGGQVVAGDVVVVDTTVDNGFKTTTTAGDPNVLGVALETIAAGAMGKIATCKGLIAQVNVNGTTTRGQYIQTHTVAKQGVPSSTRTANAFARAIQARTGAGLVTCIMLGAMPASFNIADDPGGLASTVEFSNVTVGTSGATNPVITPGAAGGGPATPTTVAGWIKAYVGTTPVFIPYFT